MATRKWDVLYDRMDALTPEDRDEIALKVQIVGELVRARKSKGLSQAELGQAAGMKQPMIARLENDSMDPQLSTVLKILRPLGMTLRVVPIDQQQTGD